MARKQKVKLEQLAMNIISDDYVVNDLGHDNLHNDPNQIRISKSERYSLVVASFWTYTRASEGLYIVDLKDRFCDLLHYNITASLVGDKNPPIRIMKLDEEGDLIAIKYRIGKKIFEKKGKLKKEVIERVTGQFNEIDAQESK